MNGNHWTLKSNIASHSCRSNWHTSCVLLAPVQKKRDTELYYIVFAKQIPAVIVSPCPAGSRDNAHDDLKNSCKSFSWPDPYTIQSESFETFGYSNSRRTCYNGAMFQPPIIVSTELKKQLIICKNRVCNNSTSMCEPSKRFQDPVNYIKFLYRHTLPRG